MNNNNLYDLFLENAKKVETNVIVIENIYTNVIDSINSITKKSEKILISHELEANKLLFEKIKNSICYLKDPTDIEMEQAEFSLTDSFASIARTGSICISVSNKLNSSFSLFSKEHIVIAKYDDIVLRPRDLFLDQRFIEIVTKHNLLFISGSSATADMGPLVRGVHAPAKLHIIFIK